MQQFVIYDTATRAVMASGSCEPAMVAMQATATGHEAIAISHYVAPENIEITMDNGDVIVTDTSNGERIDVHTPATEK